MGRTGVHGDILVLDLVREIWRNAGQEDRHIFAVICHSSKSFMAITNKWSALVRLTFVLSLSLARPPFYCKSNEFCRIRLEVDGIPPAQLAGYWRNCCSPRRISITAIAASKRLMIFDSAFDPASPISRNRPEA